MPENEQVTISFGGYDNTPDNTIMFEGPLTVWKTIDDVNNLYLLDLSSFTEGDPVIVFVRNVNKQDPTKPLRGEIGYRGSFFKYDWEHSGWQQIALGNHSHANIEILDQIGDIDTSMLKPGEKKVLTLEKTDPDQDSNIRTTDYKVSFEDQKELPDVPVDAFGKELYLTTDKDGKFQWKNSFVPAQTFKMAKVIVSSDFALPDDKTKDSFKSLFLSQEYLTTNEILFNKDLQDEILVFDSGDLVSDLSYNTDDTGLTLTINNPNQTFDIGETINILIIRNGIAGIIDTIENQYLTKKDAVEILSDGTIHLNQYTTKKDLQDYAAKIKHHHSEYIRKDDYDIFDFRYADYQHTHSQYVTSEQVYGILVDIAGGTGEINPDTAFQDIVKEIDKKLAEFDNKFYSKDQIISLIEAAKKQVSNTDAIEVTFDGRNLTDYLKYLDEKQIELAPTYDNKILLSNVEVQLGEDELGSYSSGDIIEKGTTLTQFIRKLVQKEIPPKLIDPEILFDYTLSNTDVGASSKFIFTPHFKSNDGGELISLKMYIYSSDIRPENATEIILNNDEMYGDNFIMNPYNSDGDCYTVEIIAEYAEGSLHKNNLNNGKIYQIKAGSKTEYLKIKANRKCYIGSMPIFLNESNLNGDTIHQHAYSSFDNPLTVKDITEKDFAEGLTLTFNEFSHAKSYILAIPEDYNAKLTGILFINQNFDVMDDLSLMKMIIPDSANNCNELINNNYNVYYLSLANELQSSMTFKLKFEKIRKDGDK